MCAALAEPPLPFLCINVESSRERLQWQREQSATFGVSVVPVAAVVPGSDAYAAGERRFGHLWMRGENEWRGPAANAIVLSWLGALRRAAKRKEAWVLVGEDDAVFAPDFRPRLAALRDRLPAGALGVFLHALGVPEALAPYSEHSHMTFPPPPGGWGRGAVFDDWPRYEAATDERVMSGDPAICLMTPRGAGHLAELMEREVATHPWNPFDQVVPYLATAGRVLLAGDPGLVWELARQDPQRAGAASNREALDGKAAFVVERRGEPAAKPVKRKFKIGAKRA